MKSKPENTRQARKPLISALEPRLLLDGAAVATAVDVLTDSQFHDAFQTDASQQDTDTSVVMAPTEVRAADPTLNNGKKEVVFIEDNVADYQTLIDGIGAGVEVVLLDSTQDGLAQMALWAQSNSDYDAIHIISHGAEGQVNLGGFSLDNITVNTRSADLAQLGAALNEDGDLLLYGCGVASGEGQEFITALAQATQADVAASDDLTGAAVLGGDWILEKRSGVIETTDLSVGLADNYAYTLETVSFTSADANYTADTVTKTVESKQFTFSTSNTSTLGFDGGGLYGLVGPNSETQITIDVETGYSFDLTGVTELGGSSTVMVSYTNADGSTGGATAFDSAFPLNDVKQVVLTSTDYATFNDFLISDVKAIPVNNAPTITGAPADITVIEDTASNVDLSGVAFADSDGDNLTVTLTASAGTLTASSGGSVTVSNSGTGTLTLSGSAADINSYLDTTSNVQYTGASNASGDNAATLTIKANDGKTDSSISTVNIDITAVNDAPTAVSPTTGTVSTFDSANAVVATVGATDVDDSTLKYSIQSITLDSASQANDGSLFNFATAANTLTATNALRATTPSGLTAGTYIVTVVATDEAELSTTQEITITVTDTLMVTTANDTSENSDDAYNGTGYAAELADGGGLSLREALGLAEAGGKTIAFDTSLNGADISLDSNITVADGTVFQLADGTSFTISGSDLYLDGALTIDSGVGTTLTLSANLTDEDDGVSTLNKTGTGTLVLSGTNNTEVKGLDIISVTAGTLQISADANLGTGDVILSGGAIFDTLNNVLTAENAVDNIFSIEIGGATFNQTGSGHLELSDTVGGSGLLTKAGAGSMTFSAINEGFHGGVQINNGTVNAASEDESLGYAGTVTLNGGTLVISNDESFTNEIAVNADATISNSTNVTLNKVISGSGALTKAGAGTMTWSGINTHSGDLIVSAGALAVSGGSSIGDDSAVTVNSGATLSLIGGNETIGSLAGSGAVALTYGLTVGNAISTEFSGTISSTNASGITKVGTGKLTLSGENNYTGTTTVSAGTLSISRDSNLGSGQLILNGGILNLNAFSSTLDNAIVLGASVGTVSVTNGGTAVISGVISGDGNLSKIGGVNLTLSGNNTYTGTTSISGANGLSITGDSNLGSGQVILQTADTVLTITGATTIDNEILFNQNATISAANAVALNGVITGTGALTKSGAGVLTLSGNNADYSGDIFLSQGVIIAAHNNALGNTAGSTTVSSGSTLRVGNGLTLAENLTISGVGIDSSYGALKINEGTGSATVTGDITLAADSLIGAFNTGDSLTLSGVISGDFDLTKVGSGTLTLSGSNTHTGAVTVSGGTLALLGGSSIGDDSAVTVNSGTTLSLTGGNETIGSLSGSGAVALTYGLTVGNAINTAFTGVISSTNTSGITKVGSGTLALSGANTYTGATTVSAGKLLLQNGSAIADSSAVTISSGAELELRDSETVGSLAGAGSLTLNGGSLTTGGNNSDTTFSGVIEDGGNGGGLTKTGSGDFTLSGSNSYAGDTAVFGGSLSVSSDSNLGAGVLTLNGGTLNLIADGVHIDNAISVFSNNGQINVGASLTATLSGVVSGSGSLTKVGDGTLALSGTQTGTGEMSIIAGTLSVAGDANLLAGALTLNGGNLSVTGATTIDNAIDLSSAGSITNLDAVSLSGIISGVGDLTKLGVGTLTLSGTQTGTGAMTVSAGTLAVSGDANLLAGGLTLNNGTLTVTGSGVTIDNALTLGSSGGTVSNSNAVTLSGAITGTGDLSKTGAGVLTLSNTGNEAAWSGDISVTAGTLTVINDDVLSSGSINVTGGTLELGNSVNLDNAVTLGAGGVLLPASGKTATLSGNLALTSDATFNLGVNTNLTISGVISGDYGITKSGSASLHLTGNNTYTGATVINAGLVTAGTNTALGATESGTTVNSGGTLSFANGVNVAENLTIAGTGSSLNGALVMRSSGTATLTGAVTLSGDATVKASSSAYTLVLAGVISDGNNGYALSKTGTGTVTLSGINTYTGATNVSLGTLLVTGALNGTSAVTVSYDATLGASGNGNTGTIFAANSSNTVTVESGGTLSPGLTSSVGLMTINGNLDLQSGSTLRVDIAGTTAGSLYDVVDVRGSVSLAGALTVNHNYTPGNGDTYRIITNDSADAITGTFTGLAEAGTLTAGGNATVLTGYYAASDVAATTGGNDFMLRAPANEAPVITSGATGSVNENADVATVIYTAAATDADNNALSYSLTGDDVALLTIDSSTGVVTLKSSANYESKNTYSFNVVVTDNGTGNLTDTIAITVSVNDLNDNTPVITSSASGSVNENADTSTVIYTATGTDADGTAANNTLRYSLSGDDADHLTIDTTTGVVTLKAAADYETKSSYSFNVIATDNGAGNFNSGSLSVSKAIVVSVNDLNDNTPVMTSGASGSVNENADTSTVIYTATGTDADGTAANSTLVYSLSGDDADKLNINATTGEVTLKASADYETQTSYSFNVVATDNGAGNFNSGSLSTTQAVTVSVNDLNDNTPVITSGATGAVNENAATSTVIYTVTASDADGTTANNTLTYSLTGTDASLLDINA
ncbi:autotransporter-associated beta strand repeat-containing protein, partial [Marinomonas arctica]